jgi:hypothetical protein
MTIPLTISDFLDRAADVVGLEKLGELLAAELNRFAQLATSVLCHGTPRRNR